MDRWKIMTKHFLKIQEKNTNVRDIRNVTARINILVVWNIYFLKHFEPELAHREFLDTYNINVHEDTHAMLGLAQFLSICSLDEAKVKDTAIK